MTEKVFKSITEQIALLKSKNLEFDNEVAAAQQLSNYGYYEIINGYRTTFLAEDSQFKQGTKFEDIFGLYFFDSRLRNAILGSLDYAETNLKQKLAHILAENHGLDFDEYISVKVFDSTGSPLPYQNPEKGLYNSRDLFFQDMKKIYNKKAHPFKHYREEHKGKMPPWILVKGMSFGNLRTAITLLNSKDKTLLVKRLYSQETLSELSDNELKKMLHDTIRAIHNYRNRAAHGGRLYNFFPVKGYSYNRYLHSKAKISKTALGKKKVNPCSIHLMMTSLSLWDNKLPSVAFDADFENLLRYYSDRWEEQNLLVLEEMQMPKAVMNFKKK